MKLLVRCGEGNRTVRVFESLRDGARLYYDGGILYTHIDREGGNLLEYVRAMDQALVDAGRVLALGTAGGALATQLIRRGATVTAVDNCAAAFDIARKWFHLPDQVECVHADALEYLKTTPRQWDAIAIDVYLGTEIPKSMLTDNIADILTGADSLTLTCLRLGLGWPNFAADLGD